MADVPRDLITQINQIETLFTVTPQKLISITEHFIQELNKGLSVGGGNIPMIPGWVLDFPDGTEKGNYLAIDLGGTNLRIVLVKLGGDRTFDTTQSKYALPASMRTGSADNLFNFIADCLKKFVDEEFPQGVDAPLPLGFTFSYPASQDAINEGFLQRWTKGFDIDGVEGENVVPMLQKAIALKQVPIEIVALINDTTGTLVASMYTDEQALMGLIFGTGVNGAYYDVVKDVPKIQGRLPDDITGEMPMAINCEYGSFDNEHLVLPRTKYDVQIDSESPRPGQQTYEKMIAGYYLGEILRLILLDMYNDGFIFEGQDISKLKETYVMDTSYPARIEEDPYENLNEVETLFQDLGIQTTEPERKLIRKVCEIIATRASRLSMCGVAAICKKRGYTKGHCAADGSVFNKYPGFQDRAHLALRDIFGWSLSEPMPITLVQAEDGSGVGAAVIAALTEKRLQKGLSVGVKK